VRLSADVVRVWIALAVASLAMGISSARADPLGFVPGYDDPQPSFVWQGSYQQQSLYFTSTESGTSLYATVYAPADLGSALYPVVVILPGSQIGVQAQYAWAARDLAGHGYIAITVDEQQAGRSGEDANDPCGPGTPSPSCATTPNKAGQAGYVDALESSIDFMLSPRDPFYAHIDPTEVGAAGHSAGADLISWYQAVDSRIKAIVAWDNLISSPTGDQGNADCGRTPTTLITPRVPALGEASETCISGTTKGETPGVNTVGPEAKKTGYERWRSQGEPTMETVFNGVQHLEFAQEDNIDAGLLGGTVSGSEKQLHNFEYYTRAWFDLWLRHDNSATQRLLASTVNGQPLASVLSGKYISAIYLPTAGIDCENLLSCPALAPG
jgi:dienelactone hydrolase